MGDELAWKLNGHLAATLCNTAAFSRARQPLDAEDCLWRQKPKEEEIHAAAKRPGHVARVAAKLAVLFPGLNKKR